jgi:hypothetical protein
MSYEVSISGISTPTCECNPYTRAETAIKELMEMISSKRGELHFKPEDVCKVVATYECRGSIKGDCSKMCGQLLTASLFAEGEVGLLSGDFMSQVSLD